MMDKALGITPEKKRKGNGDGFDLRRNEQLAEAAMEESDTGLLKYTC